MQPYTLEHSLPPYVTLDTITRPDGAQYFHVQDDILHTHAAVTIDLDEIRSASLYDSIYQHTVN